MSLFKTDKERGKSMFSEAFLIEIKELALQIAKNQRGQDHLQDLDTLYDKFRREREELWGTAHPWDELPDVGYYTACMQIVGNGSLRAGSALMWLANEINERGV